LKVIEMLTLDELAGEIRTAHADVCRLGLHVAERAVDAGRWLLEAKDPERPDPVPQGGWKLWVEKEAGVPYRTAQHYIQLSVAISVGSATLQDIAELGQIGALKLAAIRESEARREASRNAPVIPDGLDYRVGDCRIVLADIADNSVPLILTDPPYGDEAELLYEWLGMWARRVLIPGGSLICYAGHSRHDRDMAILSAQLRYWWLCSMPHDQTERLPGKFVMIGFKPILWFVKGFRRGRTEVPDVFISPARDKLTHAWAQGEGGVWVPIEHLTEPGELIVDPFAGTGTWGGIAKAMGRRWIGADIVAGGAAEVCADDLTAASA
jgi:hypothetical protein